ncbi:MAG: hypothetical protein M1820_010339, partial [Bogoriella megaspora]
PGGAGEKMALKLMGRSAEEGSRTLVHGAVAGPETQGQYVSDGQVKPAGSFVRSKEGAEMQIEVWRALVARLEHVKPGISKDL